MEKTCRAEDRRKTFTKRAQAPDVGLYAARRGSLRGCLDSSHCLMSSRVPRPLAGSVAAIINTSANPKSTSTKACVGPAPSSRVVRFPSFHHCSEVFFRCYKSR